MTDPAHSPYLEDIPLEEALTRWWLALAEAGLDTPLPGEPVALAEAAGRFTAEPVWALVSSPHYHASAMDGYAVRAEDTLGASETRPLRLEIGRQAFYVDTGDPLPPGTNAVIMVEDVQLQAHADAQAIEILSTVAPWQHVRPMGEDMVATELVLPANHRLRPQDIGAAAGSGHVQLSVRREATGGDPADRHRIGVARRQVAAGRYHRVQLAGAGGDGRRVGRPARPPAAAGR